MCIAPSRCSGMQCIVTRGEDLKRTGVVTGEGDLLREFRFAYRTTLVLFRVLCCLSRWSEDVEWGERFKETRTRGLLSRSYTSLALSLYSCSLTQDRFRNYSRPSGLKCSITEFIRFRSDISTLDERGHVQWRSVRQCTLFILLWSGGRRGSAGPCSIGPFSQRNPPSFRHYSSNRPELTGSTIRPCSHLYDTIRCITKQQESFQSILFSPSEFPANPSYSD